MLRAWDKLQLVLLGDPPQAKACATTEYPISVNLRAFAAGLLVLLATPLPAGGPLHSEEDFPVLNY